MIRTKLKSNFWHPTQWDDDTHLYLDELGWNDAAQSDAHATDSWNIFRFYLEHYGFDLVLYLVEFDEFYYIDNIECKQVLKLANRPDWDGKYILDRVEISSCPEIEPEVIFEYREVKDLWDHLQIHGLSMEEIIDKSVVMVEH